MFPRCSIPDSETEHQEDPDTVLVEVRERMKNSKGPRARKADSGATGSEHLQLDLWSFSPPPVDTSDIPTVDSGPKIEAPPPPAPHTAVEPSAISSNDSTESLQDPDLKSFPKPIGSGVGRWPARHGVKAALAPLASIANVRSPSAPPETIAALTRRQHELLEYLRRRRVQGLLPPSLTEICRDLGLASRGSLHKQVVALVKANLVEPMLGKQRGVRLVGEAANDDGRVPLLGAIAAGRPIEAVLRPESVEVPPWMTRGLRCYALRVKGDSMRDAGILDGDVVLVEPRTEARNGETVVALIDNEEATLKRIEQRPGEVLLIPENSAHTVQRYTPDRVQVQGVAMGVLRRY